MTRIFERSLLRTLGFFLAASLGSVPFLAALPFFLLPTRLGWPIVVLYLKMLLFLLRHICKLDFELRGRENLPPSPCLIAPQHQSTWENLFFQIVFDNPAMFVKKEIFSYPIAGLIATKNRHIMTDRTGTLASLKRSFDAARAHVRDGRDILIYPGGTRRPPRQPQEIRPGVGALYRVLGCPCVPVRLNTGYFWPRGSWTKYPGLIVIDIQPPIQPGLSRAAFRARLTETLNVTLPPIHRPSQRKTP